MSSLLARFKARLRKVRGEARRRRSTPYVLDGSPILLPEGHMLPIIRVDHPHYAANVARLARSLRAKYGDLAILDIGANIGDTVAILRREVDSPILCIEGSQTFMPFLKANLASFKDVELEPSYVATGSVSSGWESVESGVRPGSPRRTKAAKPPTCARCRRFWRLTRASDAPDS